MSPRKYNALLNAFVRTSVAKHRKAFLDICREVDKACQADGFTRDECFELLVDIRNLLDSYQAEQLDSVK